MTSATLLTYRRGTEVFSSFDDNKKSPFYGKTAHAVRGTIEVGGCTFDTLERLETVTLPKDRVFRCTMETAKNFDATFVDGGKVYSMKRRQLRPQAHGRMVTKSANGKSWLQEAAILIHPGKHPHDFLGCIGVGELRNGRLMESTISLETIFVLCNGFEDGKEVMLSVNGDLPSI